VSGSVKVDDWMANADNPFKDLWEIIRRTILNTDPKMEEDINGALPRLQLPFLHERRPVVRRFHFLYCLS
jgi:hypothetical protein